MWNIKNINDTHILNTESSTMHRCIVEGVHVPLSSVDSVIHKQTLPFGNGQQRYWKNQIIGFAATNFLLMFSFIQSFIFMWLRNTSWYKEIMWVGEIDTDCSKIFLRIIYRHAFSVYVTLPPTNQCQFSTIRLIPRCLDKILIIFFVKSLCLWWMEAHPWFNMDL